MMRIIPNMTNDRVCQYFSRSKIFSGNFERCYTNCYVLFVHSYFFHKIGRF